VVPETHALQPVHPAPPHCPYSLDAHEDVPVEPVVVLVAADEVAVAVDVAVDAPAEEVQVATDDGPVGVSPIRTHPERDVSAAGHATVS